MRTFLTLALVAGSAALFADGNTATTSAEAAVRIYSPIGIYNVFGDKLDFAQIVINDVTKPASVVMPATYYPTLQDFDNCAVKNGSPSASAAWFHVNRDSTLTYTLGIDPIVDLGDGVKITTSHSGLTLCSVAPTPMAPFALAGTTQEHFYVGGKLEVPAFVIGHKTGTLNVSVSYN